MPLYNYACKVCENKLRSEHAVEELSDLMMIDAVFETKHQMHPTEDELLNTTKCPRCGSNDTYKYMHGLEIIGYVAGNGYLDIAGCKRDMSKYHLTKEDPYAQYRQPGEVDYLKDKLNKKGPDTKKHFT